MAAAMTPDDVMHRIDRLLSHVWMVRTFLKHCEEAESDEELQEVHRTLYDVMLALGAPFKAGDADAYLKMARKKLSRLIRATSLFLEIQPEVSAHMNFCMAARSLETAVREIESLLQATSSTKP